MYGTLYLIPCPISDETAPWDVLPAANRAVMDSLDYFIVENTRSARRFLSRAGIQRPIDSLRFAELNEHSTPEAVAELLTPVLAGTDAGVISEAGLPGVADPGADLAALAHLHGVEVVPLVGPSSILLALMASINTVFASPSVYDEVHVSVSDAFKYITMCFFRGISTKEGIHIIDDTFRKHFPGGLFGQNKVRA